MGMLYVAQFNAVAVTAQQDFFELTVPSDCVTLIHWIELSQTSELSDAQEEQLLLLMKRGVGSTSGSGGSAPTPTKLESGFAAAGTAVEVNNTTRMTGGTITTFEPSAWNIRIEKTWIAPPEWRIPMSPSERFTVELATTPADSITMNGFIKFEEIGG